MAERRSFGRAHTVVPIQAVRERSLGMTAAPWMAIQAWPDARIGFGKPTGAAIGAL
jgi:hypothetical protein